MLSWNKEKVKNLTGAEIWLFIAGRVFIAFGIGILCARYYPQVAESLVFPTLVIGIVLLAIAAKGLFRRSQLN